jgi:hypothetical protein
MQQGPATTLQAVVLLARVGLLLVAVSLAATLCSIACGSSGKGGSRGGFAGNTAKRDATAATWRAYVCIVAMLGLQFVPVAVPANLCGVICGSNRCGLSYCVVRIGARVLVSSSKCKGFCQIPSLACRRHLRWFIILPKRRIMHSRGLFCAQ